MTVKNQTTVIIGVYIQPDLKSTVFLQLEMFIQAARQIQPRKQIVIAGDFNDANLELVDTICENYDLDYYRNHCENLATRPATNPTARLDLVLSNITQTGQISLENWSRSDHLPIMVTLVHQIEYEPVKTSYRRCLRKNVESLDIYKRIKGSSWP